MLNRNSVILFLTENLFMNANNSFFIGPNKTQKPSSSELSAPT